MDLLTYLLGKLAEEAAELSQAASKAQQNGLDSFNPKEKDTGENIITKEANDVLGIISMLKRVAKLNDPRSPALFAGLHDIAQLDKKERKVIYYAQYPVKKGKLILNDTERDWFEQVLEQMDPNEFQ